MKTYTSIELTPLHSKIVDSIKSELSIRNRIKPVRKQPADSSFEHIKTFVKNLFAFLLELTKDRNFIISHPLNIWTAMALILSRRIVIIDDGIAYYYDAKIIKNFYTKIYLAICSRKFNKNPSTFPDFLSAKNIEVYYSLLPDRAKKITPHINIMPIKIQKKHHQKTQNNHLIFLDSSKDTYSLKFAENAAKAITDIASSLNAKIEVKPHPHSIGKISEMLPPHLPIISNTDPIETYIEKNNITHIISIYSSVIITSKIIDSSINCICLTDSELIKTLPELHRLMEELDVKFIMLNN